MKRTINYIVMSVLVLTMASCVTGNNDSEVLRDHNDALAKTPQVLSLLVNGEAMQRDSLSNWIPVFAKAGDVLDITAELNIGNGASSSDFQFSRYYYATSTPYGLEDGVDIDYALLDQKEFGVGVAQLTYTYTVPALDDDDFDFLEGDHINIAFWTINNAGGAGYNDFTIEYTE
jgi:hypothetical protein